VVTLTLPIITTQALLTIPTVKVQKATPQPGMEVLPDQQQAYQEEQQAQLHAQQIDAELQAAQCHDELIGKSAFLNAQLTELHRCKAVLRTERAATIDFTKAQAQAMPVVTTINCEGPPRPTFAKASQNMAVVVALLYTLPAPSTNGVDRVYHQLGDILGVAAEQQAENSLQRWVNISVLSPGHSRANQQRTMTELPAAGTTSSPMPIPTHLQPGHLSGHPEPLAHHQARKGVEGRILSIECATRTTAGTTIEKGATSAPMGQGPRRS
jgi:hypothetical protein